MREIPVEVIYRYAFNKTAEYFAGRLEQKRREGFVAVLVEDFWDSLYFMPCNKLGYPRSYYLETLELPKISTAWLTEGEIPIDTSITFSKITIQVEKPLISQRFDFEDYPYIFMWSGKRMGTERLPIDKLNVQELMRVAQLAIKNREGLIIDEALKNKIYK